ncbi:hypothetical protein JW979_13055 [bacterium]|nr:hypothetical protein [candidate division CSSED10-310 bacterium]
MLKKLVRSRIFWIFLGICIFEEVTVFFPFLSVFLLAAAIAPSTGMRYAMLFIEHYNKINNTHFEILDISQAKSDLKAVKPIPS